MAQRAVSEPVSLRLPPELASKLVSHLFPGDEDEHGAVVGAAVFETSRGYRLLGRRLFLAEDGIDYVPGNHGYRMLTPEFVLRCSIACADEELAYLAVHNHPGTHSVAFSDTDMESHRKGYPALIDILDGPPAGALVLAQQAVAGDIWVSANQQKELDHSVIVGRSQRLGYPSPRKSTDADAQYDRQLRLFGDRGQEILATQKVGIVGAGGGGSLINEYLARLGVGHIVIVDDDRLDSTNIPRVAGACAGDLRPWYRFRPLARLLGWQPSSKVSIAERVAREAKSDIRYEAIIGNVVDQHVVKRLLDCDAIFLAADSMQARLVVNAVCHQYLIPVWQVGAKVDSDSAGQIQDVFSVVRQLVPGRTCLWCNGLINPARLAEEAASPQQRIAQRYVEEVPAPSVITLNAVASSHAVDQYLFATLELQETPEDIHWLKYRSADPNLPYVTVEVPRGDSTCSQCQGRLGAGELRSLPVRAT